jgi:hypothetical protein
VCVCVCACACVCVCVCFCYSEMQSVITSCVKSHCQSKVWLQLTSNHKTIFLFQICYTNVIILPGSQIISFCTSLWDLEHDNAVHILLSISVFENICFEIKVQCVFGFNNPFQISAYILVKQPSQPRFVSMSRLSASLHTGYRSWDYLITLLSV